MHDYEVAVDLPRRFLRLTLRGFWDRATFDAFAAEFEEALRRFQRHGGCAYALIDGREFAVQALDISERFGQLIAAMAPIAARRSASIVPASLNRLQAERAGDSIHARTFTDLAEGEAWLFSHPVAAAHPAVAQD
jgi:hypothetical protein